MARFVHAAMLGWMRAIFRLTYNTDDGYDAQTASVSLINASNAMNIRVRYGARNGSSARSGFRVLALGLS